MNEVTWQVRLLLQLLNISLKWPAEGAGSVSHAINAQGPGDSQLTLPGDIIERLKDKSGIGEFAELVNIQKLVVPVYEAISRCISGGAAVQGSDAQIEESAADDAALDVLLALRDKLRNPYYADLMKAAEQDEDIQYVINALDRAGIDSIPLKGWMMRSSYPSRLMRSMCDFDILVREFDEDRINAAMRRIGYEPESFTGGKHEHYRGRSGLVVEVHRRLTDRTGYACEWESKVWERAGLMSGRNSIFEMSPEDMYIFHLLHMEDDACHGALPLRAICDIYRFFVDCSDVDRGYMEGELKRLGILEFACRMEKLTAVCFKGEEPDEDMQLLLNFYMNGHMLGSPKRNALSRAALNSESNPAVGLFKSRLRQLFMPVSLMKEQFPALKRHPALLPIYRVRRFAGMVRRYRADAYRRNYDKLSEAELKEMQAALKAAGIRRR